jgi:F-type H+-transporting ATPase subunit b
VQINWVTFTLEIVNFLILVWILQRFLYKPILQSIARRKAAIEKTLADAKSLHKEAEDMEQRYRDRLAVWEEEKARLRMQAEGEVAAERARRMTALQHTLTQEREKHRALEQRQWDDQRKQLEQEALAQGAEFAARLLARLAAPDLEKRLLRMVLEDLPQHTDDVAKETRQLRANGEIPVNVASAFPLAENERRELEQGLRAVIGSTYSATYSVDPQLQAGLRIGIGPCVLRANLQDELKFFAETSHRAA